MTKLSFFQKLSEGQLSSHVLDTMVFQEAAANTSRNPNIQYWSSLRYPATEKLTKQSYGFLHCNVLYCFLIISKTKTTDSLFNDPEG